jgi:hypothetical protein
MKMTQRKAGAPEQAEAERRGRMPLEKRSKTMRWRLAAVLVALLCAAPLVMAQPSLIFNVPFPFVAQDTKCPPGEYSFLRERGEASRLVVVRNTGTGEGILLVADFLDTHHDLDAGVKLVFYRYGDRYFLREIREGGGVRAALAPGKEERQLQVAGARESRTEVLARLR